MERKTNMYKCPRCSGTLSTQLSENVETEICSNCGGTWLDVNELKQLDDKELRAEVDKLTSDIKDLK